MPRTVRNVKRAILQALTEAKKLTWSEIKKKTALSKGALSKHLNDLIEDGVVKTSTVDTRPPTTAYRLAAPGAPEMLRRLDDFERLALQGASAALQTGDKIRQLKDRDVARGLLTQYLRSNMTWIMTLVLEYMQLAAAVTGGFEERLRDGVKAVAIRERKYEAYLDELRGQLRRSIANWIEAVATTVFVNGSLAYGTDGAVAKVIEGLMDEIDADWIDELERKSVT